MRKGTTYDATPDFDLTSFDTCGASLQSKGVWYTLETDTRRIIRTEYTLHKATCSLSIFTGSCGNNLVCLSSHQKYRGVNHDFVAEANTRYSFLLSGRSADDVGEYEFTVSTFEIPGNNECKTSIDIAVLPFSSEGSTLGATPYFDSEANNLCEGMDWYTRGVWYHFLGGGTILRVESDEKSLTLFKGSCDDLICLSHGYAVTEFWAEVGSTYHIMLTGNRYQPFTNAGAYRLDVSEYAVPDNDSCETASSISDLPATIRGSTKGSRPDFNNEVCGASPDGFGVWYSFTGAGNIITFTTSTTEQYKTVRYTVFSGPCGSLSCEQSYDLFDRSGQFVTENGTDYKLLLTGEDFDDRDNFELQINQYSFAMNDLCKDAVELKEFPFSGDMKGATPDTAIQCVRYTTSSYPGVWFSYVGTGNLIGLDATLVGSWDWALLTGFCDGLSCHHRGSEYSRKVLTFETELGVQYYFFLATKNNLVDNPFTIAVAAENAWCEDAVNIQKFPFSYSGEVKGSTNNTDISCTEGRTSTNPGVWFSYVGTGNLVNWTISFDDSSWEWASMAGSCDRLICYLQDSERGQEVLTFQTIVGRQYFFYISSGNNIDNSFSVEVVDYVV